MTTTNLENVKQRINEFKSAPADQRQYTGYASWVNWFTDLEWAIARIEALEAQLPSVESAAPAAPATTTDAPVTAPVPSPDSAAGNANIGSSLTFIKESTMVKLTTKRRELLARIKSSEGFLGYKNLTSSEKNMVKWLEENDLVARNHDHGYEALSITPAGIAAPAVPAPRVPDALVPIHGDPLDGLRKAIEGHAALSKLEAMTKLYEIQRMAKDIISSDFGSVTPQVVIRLRGLRIEEMGPSDCVIELIKLAEMLAPGMTLSAAQVTAPGPAPDSAAGKVKLTITQITTLRTLAMPDMYIEYTGVIYHRREGNYPERWGYSCRQATVKVLIKQGLISQNESRNYDITDLGRAALAQR